MVFFLLISASLLYISISASASGFTFNLGGAAYYPDSNITQDGYVHLTFVSEKSHALQGGMKANRFQYIHLMHLLACQRVMPVPIHQFIS